MPDPTGEKIGPAIAYDLDVDPPLHLSLPGGRDKLYLGVEHLRGECDGRGYCILCSLDSKSHSADQEDNDQAFIGYQSILLNDIRLLVQRECTCR